MSKKVHKERSKKFHKNLAIILTCIGGLLVAGAVTLFVYYGINREKMPSGISGGYLAGGLLMISVSLFVFIYAGFSFSIVKSKDAKENVKSKDEPSVSIQTENSSKPTEKVQKKSSVGRKTAQKIVSKKIKCPKCETINEGGARFCQNCGVKFVIVKRCSKCGKKLDDTQKICPDCGTEVE